MFNWLAIGDGTAERLLPRQRKSLFRLDALALAAALAYLNSGAFFSEECIFPVGPEQLANDSIRSIIRCTCFPIFHLFSSLRCTSLVVLRV